jgi:hypothetical protein
VLKARERHLRLHAGDDHFEMLRTKLGWGAS